MVSSIRFFSAFEPFCAHNIMYHAAGHPQFSQHISHNSVRGLMTGGFFLLFHNVYYITKFRYVLCCVQSVEPLKPLYTSPRRTCSFRHQLDFAGKHSAGLQLLHKEHSLTFPPAPILQSWVNIVERPMNIVKASKQQHLGGIRTWTPPAFNHRARSHQVLHSGHWPKAIP